MKSVLAWAVIIKYWRPCGLNNINLFSQGSEGWKSKIRVSSWSDFGENSLLRLQSHLFRCPHTVERALLCLSLSMGCQPCLLRTHMTSFTFYHLLLLGHSHSWRLRLQYMNFVRISSSSLQGTILQTTWLILLKGIEVIKNQVSLRNLQSKRSPRRHDDKCNLMSWRDPGTEKGLQVKLRGK